MMNSNSNSNVVGSRHPMTRSGVSNNDDNDNNDMEISSNNNNNNNNNKSSRQSPSSSLSSPPPGVIIEPMEMESLISSSNSSTANNNNRNIQNNNASSAMLLVRRPSARRRLQGSHNVHPIDQLWHMIKLFMELNPIFTTVIVFVAVGFVLRALFVAIVPIGGGASRRHKLGRYDYYSRIDMNYNFKASKMDHWCLFGDDDSCPCEDFIDPTNRAEHIGWRKTHEHNVKLIDASKHYDVVFLGDETTEIWNGRWMNIPINLKTANNPNLHIRGNQVRKFWNQTFTKAGGGQFDGLALGIAGDSSSNLLWRIQKGGEVPSKLKAKVWWVLIGTNDLARGGCSEEATTLGILRSAEEIHHIHPESVIVLQGILPRTHMMNGKLESESSTSLGANVVSELTHHAFHKNPRTAKIAREHALLWPSIKRINQQLEEFCSNHQHLVYFDASKLFLGSFGNEYYHDKSPQIIPSLMPNYKNPSAEGMELMGKYMAKELDRIINKHDERNDIAEIPKPNNAGGR